MNGFRPPVYGPGQSAALMEDPMSLMLMMMGMPALQQAMGQNNFIPHFTPAQAMNDQFIASKYQRAQFNSLNAASEQGNAAVAARLLGLRSMVTDAPASQLNKEQASMFASMINNPVSKALIASQMGPDNMEALFFGRKGDPSALAATSNRLSFFRKDTLGQENRMTGESMEEFSTNIYQNLYGKGADVDAMHGFMAGQTGQVMENLFQRGQLPQSLGELTPAERVKAISSAQRDDATMTRLAEQFGHKELLKDEKYAGATIEERKKMLEARTPSSRVSSSRLSLKSTASSRATREPRVRARSRRCRATARPPATWTPSAFLRSPKTTWAPSTQYARFSATTALVTRPWRS